jgi:hypothetical protein
MLKPTHIFLFLTIASFPLYLLPSGGVQISHGFFAIFFVSFFGQIKRSYRSFPQNKKRIFKAIAAFVVVTCVVQTGWVLVHGSYRSLLFAGFYIFNSLYFYSIYVYLTRYQKRGANLIFLATLTSIGIVFGGLLAGISMSAYRRTSFFNNPNQLGYFALLTTLIVLLFHTRSTVKYARLLSIFAVLINLYLSSVSLSKAAMVSTAASLVVFLPMFKKSHLLLLIIVIGASYSVWLPRVMNSVAYSRAKNRIQRIGADQDDSILGRGYGRISSNPEYLLTGAGEGNSARWGAEHEIHSLFANMLFCYGIAGFGVFCLFLFRCYSLSPWIFIVLFLPVFAYGATHNGVRFSYMWLLFAVFLYIADTLRPSHRRVGYLSGNLLDVVSPQDNQNQNLNNQFRGNR